MARKGREAESVLASLSLYECTYALEAIEHGAKEVVLIAVTQELERATKATEKSDPHKLCSITDQCGSCVHTRCRP